MKKRKTKKKKKKTTEDDDQEECPECGAMMVQTIGTTGETTLHCSSCGHVD